MTVSAFAGQTKITTDRNSTRKTDSGGNLSATLTRRLRDGSAQLSFGKNMTADGDRLFVTAGRSQTLARDRSLSYSLGLSKTENTEIKPFLNLFYATPSAKGGSFAIDLRQAVSTNGDDEAILRSDYALVYAIPLTGRLILDFDLGYRRIANIDTDDSTRNRADAEVDFGYRLTRDTRLDVNLAATETWGDDEERRRSVSAGVRRVLTKDWDLSARAEQRWAKDGSDSWRDAQILSLGISRSIDFRP